MKRHIRFLKRNKKDLKGNLRLDCSVEGVRFRKYLNIKIAETNWNKNNERVKRSYTNAFQINKRLDLICNTIENIYYELANDDIPISVSVLSDKFDEKINGVNRRTSFFEYTNEFIETSKISKTKETVSAYCCTINSIKEFQLHYRRKIDWSSFDHKFYDDYQSFQYKIKNNNPNLFGNRISQIKAILNQARKLANKLKNDKEWYKLQSDTAKRNFKSFFGEKEYIYNMNKVIKEVMNEKN